ncbi:MAG TPA: hypothetical protein VNX21_00815 [Candidatus Thermoplasmatota archaeon]|nr:hypothetical protein [Candidatus Thermoplasmatota archaeon]
MRPAVVVALLVVGVPLSVFLPVADALDWCTSPQIVEGHGCSRHLACLHRSGTGADESCKYGLRPVCDYLGQTCDAQRVLP